jgi:CRISPR/Cas system CSM-associated protein Csm2 small subunit
MFLQQEKDISQLQYLESLPQIYESFLTEIRRRKTWARWFLNEIERIRTHLANATEREKQRRQLYVILKKAE